MGDNSDNMEVNFQPNESTPEALTLESLWSELDPVSQEDRDLMERWNNVDMEVADTCIHHLINEQVRQRPDSTAICAWDGEMSYAELDSQSTYLAKYLIGLGIAPEIYVPLCFEKSIWAIVSMLAILKAGGACVPLNPNDPPSRLVNLVKQTGAAVILVGRQQNEVASAIASCVSVSTVIVDGDFYQCFEEASDMAKKAEALPIALDTSTPRNPAFVIFTSGSTGKPKGVVLEHRSICTSIQAHGELLGINTTTRVFQFAAYTFDASIMDNFTTLIRGGCICVPSETGRMNNLAGMIQTLKANWIFLTPTVAQLIDPSTVDCLKTMILGGEPPGQRVIDTWANAVTLYNGYGPAECSIFCTFEGPIQKVQTSKLRPLSCAIWIVDTSDHNQLVPVGTIGEILVEGPLLARGYLQDEDKTIESFIQDPSWAQNQLGRPASGRRFYKTGDFGHFDLDGSIHLVGRKDHQVKVHGQRVELGEIEHHLAIDTVQHSIVLFPTSGRFQNRLLTVISFANLETGGPELQCLRGAQRDVALVQISRLRTRLQEDLASYMVPALWLAVSSLPLGPTGKLDRQGVSRWIEDIDEETYLQAIDSNHQDAMELPSTPMEARLRQIWASVLNLPPSTVGLNRTFMSLGGDSISAMQAVSRSRSEDISITVKDVLNAKITLSQLALRASSTDGHLSIDYDEAVGVQQDLSPIQQLFFQMMPHGSNHYNQSFWLRLTQPVGIKELARALEAIVGHHAMLRARFVRVDGQWVQKITTEVTQSYRFRINDFVDTPGIASRVRASQESLDISNGPLFAAEYFHGEGDQLLMLVAHHLVVDLVSWRVIVEDLEELLQNGKLSNPKPLPFTSWCRLQAAFARDQLSPTNLLGEDLTASNITVPDNFWGMMGHNNQFSDTVRESFALDKSTTELLLGPANAALNTQPIEIFHAALISAFKNVFTNRQPPTIFHEGHGREAWDESLDILRTVGWFTTLFPIQVYEDDASYSIFETIRRTKDARRRVPRNGWSYFTSRFLNSEEIGLVDDHHPIEIALNYLGQYQQLERHDALFERWSGNIDVSDMAQDVCRMALFDVTISIEYGVAELAFSWNRQMHHQHKIRQWIAECKHSIISAVNNLMDRTPELTLHDLPLMPITYDDLDQLKTNSLPKLGLSFGNIENIYPCSPIQDGILTSQARSNADYQVYFIFEVISSNPDQAPSPELLGQAWQTVVDRHSILRTVFTSSTRGDTLFDQIVLKQYQAPVISVPSDTSGTSVPLVELSSMDYTLPRPPHRLALCQQSSGKLFVRLDISHAIIDATSISLMLQELALAYDGRLSTFSGLAYSEYISHIQGKASQQSKEYWERYLSGIEPCCFPTLTDAASSAVRTHQVQTIQADVPSLEELRVFCKLHSVTLANVFQMAWAWVLRCYTDTTDVCFGYLNSGRDIPLNGIEHTIGPFINMLICRVDLSMENADETVLEQLRSLQIDYTKSLDHQHYSLAAIQHDLKLAGRNLFNTAISIQRTSDNDDANSIKFQDVAAHDPNEYDITVHLGVSSNEVTCKMDYNTTTLSNGQAYNVACQFTHILRTLLASVETGAQDISLFSTYDQKQIEDWNGPTPALLDACVHDIVHEQAELQPSASAIDAWDHKFTYEELDSASTMLSHHLNSLGVGPEELVFLCFEKSAWAIVAQLATLKAGGCCVPIDPSHPVGRIQNIKSRANSTIVLTSSMHHHMMGEIFETVCVVDEQLLQTLQLPSVPKLATVNPSNAAFVFFTSGSTGEPKGIVIEHKSYSTSSRAHGKVLEIGPSSRVFQFSAYIYDVSVMDIFTTLMRGGCICVPSDFDRVNNLVKSINDFQVNWTFMTPTVAGLLQPSDVPGLRSLLLAGEAVSRNNVAMWSGQLKLVLGYGPAECSIQCSWNGPVKKDQDPTNIGRALSCWLWVVDPTDYDRLVPVGCPGELLVEGPLLARGYLNDKEKSLAAFVLNPKWSKVGHNGASRRMYKTGDIVRYNSDGTLQFIRRKDAQVKLHGQRVELEEVEKKIKSFESLANTMVVLPNSGWCKGRLVAVVCLDPRLNAHGKDVMDIVDTIEQEKAQINIDQTREKLFQSLPRHMIPAIWLVVKSLPLRPSGKLNRTRVTQWIEEMDEATYHLAIDADRPATELPATPMERRLQSIWSWVLNIPIDNIGVSRSFISLGGDSISAMQVLSRCRNEGISVTVKDILGAKTVAQLALRARFASQSSAVENENLSVEHDLSPIQQLHFQLMPHGPNHFNQSFFIRLKRSFLPNDLRRAIETIVSQHDMLRARFTQHSDGRWTQSISMDKTKSHIFQMHGSLDSKDISSRLRDSQESLDIKNGPVFRVDCFDMENEDQLLALIAHHLVVDLVSWRVILEDLEALLQSGTFSSNRSSLSFPSWCRIQGEYARDRLVPEKALPASTISEYMDRFPPKESKKGSTASRDMDQQPKDILPSGTNHTGMVTWTSSVPEGDYWGMTNQENYVGDVIQENFTLDKSTTELLLGTANSAFRTQPIEIFHTALLYSFLRVFTDRLLPPTIFYEGHGREPWDDSIELLRTVGWFTTLSPVQIPAVAEYDFFSLLRRTKDAHRKIPANGWSYFASRFHNQQGLEKFGQEPFEIVLNYLGHYQQLERPDALFERWPGSLDNISAEILDGVSDVARDIRRIALFDISVSIEYGQAEFAFTWNRKMSHQPEIHRWVVECKEAIVTAAAKLVNKAPEYTITDFPLVPITYQGLKRLQTEALPELGLSSLDEIEDIYPCSPIQDGILMSQVRNDATYQVFYIFEIKSLDSSKSPPNLELLHSAWQTVVDRHPILRTAFVSGIEGDGIFDQMVLKKYQAPVLFISHETLETSDMAKPLLELPPIDHLEQKPPHRLALYQESGKTFARIDISHALIDATSMTIILRDLALGYDGNLSSHNGPLYSEYISYIQSKNSSMDFWKEYLNGIEPCYFPTLHEAETGDNLGQLQNIHANISSFTKLRNFCELHSITFSNLFQTAWAWILRCYSGSTDVCFGYLNSGRDAPLSGIEDAVGPFINMLICRADMGDHIQVSQLLNTMQADFVRALEHQYYSLAETQHQLDLSGKRLFNTILSIRNHGVRKSHDQVSILIEDVKAYDPSEFDITVNVSITQEEADIDFTYWNSHLADDFASNVVQDIVQTLELLVESYSDHTTSMLNRLRALPEPLDDAPNKIPRSFDACIHHVVEDQVHQQPDAPAIHAWDLNLSYSELDALSTRLAYKLIGMGVKPEVLVPYCFEKSAWAVVAMMATLKAGGACVALNPDHPVDRLANLTRQTKAKIMLAGERQVNIAHDLATKLGIVVLVIDHGLFLHLPDAYGSDMVSNISPGNSAFVVFTSGSTGQPKGVILEHRAICTSARAHGERYGINRSSRVYQFGAYTFDISIQDNFTTLMRGGCICIPTESDRLTNLAGSMRALEANFATLPTSVARLLSPSQNPGLKTLVVGGESLKKTDLDTWTSELDFYICYGPTECSIYCSARGPIHGSEKPTNIGYPLSSKIWITNAENHNLLMPIGTIGELLIEGPLLARGYLGDVEKTASSFIKSPTWGHGRRFYKTGDLGCYNPDGTIRFVGRKDLQIKIHGQRVEVAEIEHQLHFPALQHAMVLFASSGPCKQRLVAVVCFRDPVGQAQHSDLVCLEGTQLQTALVYIATIRKQLAEKLPAYMIPAVWVPVSFFPLGSTGKLDRQHVAKWVNDMNRDTYHKVIDVVDEQATKLPATSTERHLQEIWAITLNIPVEKIGLDRSFISLGGDSITAMQVISRCRSRGLTTTMKDILSTKTISQVALRVSSVDDSFSNTRDESADIEHGLSPIQKLYFQSKPTTPNHFNQSFVVRLTRQVQRNDLKRAIEAIVSQHSMLRARFKEKADGQWTQTITADISYRFHIHESNDITVMSSSIKASQEGLDITTGPVFAADFFDVDGQEQILAMVAHHLVIDLVSWRVVLEDLEELLNTGTLSSEKSLSFPSWCRLQADYAHEQLTPEKVLGGDVRPDDINQIYDYWGLEGCENRVSDAVQQSFTLDETTTEILLGPANQSLRTHVIEILHSAVLHAFLQTFADTGRSAPTIFHEGHGREAWNANIDILRTVGWFTTLWPVHVTATSTDGPIDILRRTKDARRKVPGNGWPYFTSRFLNPDGVKELGRSQPMEILLNYHGQYQQLEREESLFERWSGALENVSDVAQDTTRLSLFDVSISPIERNQTEVSFTWNKKMYHQAEIRRWITRSEESILNLITTLASRQQEYTITDFPLLNMTYDNLEHLTGVTLPNLGLSNLSEIEDIYPCSPIQEAIIIGSIKDPQFYTVRVSWHIGSSTGGSPDLYRLVQAWDTIVSRHEVFRTVFVDSTTQSGVFDQIILKKSAGHFEQINCDEHDLQDMMSPRHQPMEYTMYGPTHKLKLYQTVDGKVYSTLDIHHALIDGTSLAVLARDFTLAYDNELSTDSGFLYSSYIEYVRDQPSQNAAKYWKSYLEGIEPCLLPTRYSEPDSQDDNRQLHTMSLDLDISSFLYPFCEKNGITPANVFMTAWAMVLRFFLGVDTVCFGTLTSGRDIPVSGIEDAIGAFINMLVSRIELKSHSLMLDVLKQAQTDYLQSLDHQHCSLGVIQNEIGLTEEPLFNTIVNIQNQGSVDQGAPSQKASIQLSGLPGHDPSEYAISLNADISSSKQAVYITYWTNKISDKHAKSIADAVEAMVLRLPEWGQLHVGDIDLLGVNDKQQISSWNISDLTSMDACVHHLVENQVLQQPYAPAICAWDGNMSYAELDNRSTRLANHLVGLGLGIGPETLVPFCFNKSVWAVVAMLAILKAGGVCVALNPEHPPARLAGLVEQTRATVVLVGRDQIHKATEISRLVSSSLLAITVDDQTVEGMPIVSGTMCKTVGPQNPAFIVFTSGSTGKPKGVILEHRNICTSARAHGTALGIDNKSRVFQFSAYTFDASIQDNFTTLMRGGCICIPSDTDRMSDLPGAIKRSAANWAFFTPTVASLLRPSEVPTLKTLLFAGEAIRQESLDTWTNAPGVDLHICYGPTECSIHCLWTGVVSSSSDPSVMGGPLCSAIWLVHPSDHNQLVPIGTVGEILVEGPLLARGYLGDQEKTTRSFIENPSWVKYQPGQRGIRRFYKTGDLGQYERNGSIRFIGRKDTQVKINGQRVELGEIENQIRLCSNIIEHAAVNLFSLPGRRKGDILTAFISYKAQENAIGELSDSLLLGSSDIQSQLAALEHNLAAALPTFMIPKIIIPLKKMPLTTSGKLDRIALRGVWTELSEDKIRAYSLSTPLRQPPSTRIEQEIHSLWVEILETKTIGREDSFFRLGGDSVKAMRLIAAARKKGIRLTVAQVFRSPTLSELAAIAGQSTESKAVPPPFSLINNVDSQLSHAAIQCAVAPSDIEDIYPCTPLQEGMMALSIHQAGSYMLQKVFDVGESDIERLCRAWEAISAAHELLRTRIVAADDDSGLLQVVMRNDQPQINWHTGNSLQEYLKADWQVPLAYGSALSRWAVINDGHRARHLVWTVHHAIYDGWSMPILLNDLSRCYYNLSLDHDMLPKFKVFTQFASNTTEPSSRSYWQSQLKNAVQRDFPRLPQEGYQPRASSQLRYLASLPLSSSRSTFTLANVIRAAWTLVVAERSNSDDIIFGMTLSGRNASLENIEHLAGPTITTVPVRVKIDHAQSIFNFLVNMQSQAVDMIPYEHTGLQNIRRMVEDGPQACAFQNLLVVHPEIQGGTKPTAQTLDINSEWSETYPGGFHTYALVVECTPKGGHQVDIEMFYDPGVMEESEMKSFGSQFEYTLQQLLEYSDNDKATLADIEFCSPQHVQTMIDWNSGSLDVMNTCVHHVFEEQVLRQPNQLAISAWDHEFTYSQLNSLSTRLGIHLTDLGVGPETMVPFCFEKSSWAIVAMLGILKAGGACVALNPDNPSNRLASLIKQTGSGLILIGAGQTLVGQHMTQMVPTEVIIIDEEFFTQLQVADISDSIQDETNSSKMADSAEVVEPIQMTDSATTDSIKVTSPTVQPHNSAFVVFTSGSTGKPKGVILEHRAVCTSAQAHGTVLGIDRTTRVFQFAAYTFDISIQDNFTTLMRGGCICVPSEQDRMDNLGSAIEQSQASWVFLTPTVARLLEPSQVPSLKTMVLAGEPVHKQDIEKWSNVLHLHMCYGPAECSIHCTWSGLLSSHSSPANVGKPLSSMIWIADKLDHDRLVPVGSVGEILVEGPLLARGYLGDAQATAQAFIHDPVWAQKLRRDRRFYKTGDLGCFNPDGTIRFVGRKDNQVKFHGQRIELGEIEHHLTQHSLQHSMVLLPRSGPCQNRLVGVVSFANLGSPRSNKTVTEPHYLRGVHKEAASVHISALRLHLTKLLPLYMIPSVWVAMGYIPLGSTGKLDRRQVTAWIEGMDDETYRQTIDADDTTSEILATPMERDLQKIWAKVLNLPTDHVRPDRSFISLGGDSISAMQVLGRCRAENITVTVKDILNAKTISQLALRAQNTVSKTNQQKEVIVGVEHTLSPIQQLYFQLMPQGHNHFNQSFILSLTRPIRMQDLARSIDAIVNHHEMLRARFKQQNNGQWTQVITTESPRLRIHDFVDVPRISAAIKSSQESLDITNGPVFAVDCFASNDHEPSQVISLVAHHLVVDLVSWRIILEDLEDMLSTGSLANPKPLPFMSWCQLQANYAKTELPPQKILPHTLTSKPVSDNSTELEDDFWGMMDRDNSSSDAIHESFTLDEPMTDLLLGSANVALRTQPVEIFHAALLHAFFRVFPDRNEPTIFHEGHGRESWDDLNIDISHTVGWFTTLWPVPVIADQEIIETIRRTKDSRRQVPKNGWPYFTSRFLNAQGIEALKAPLPMEIVLNYLGQYQQLERPDALFKRWPEDLDNTVSDIGPDVPRMALFDVIVSMQDGRIAFLFTWNRHMRHQTKIRQWIQETKQSVITAATEMSTKDPEYTLSDFPQMTTMTYEQLTEIQMNLLPRLNLSSLDEIEDIYPCSSIQKAMLTSQSRNPSAYWVQQIWEVDSTSPLISVDVNRLSASWQNVVRQHAVLRTILIPDSSFYQIVLRDHRKPPSVVQIEHEDLPPAIQHDLSSLTDASSPPHNFSIFVSTSGRIFCKLVISHAVIDGTSMSILARDLVQAYHGDYSTAPTVSYGQYLSYIKEHLDPTNSSDYWSEYLAHAQPCILPMNLQNEPLQGPKHTVVPVVYEDARQFCARENITLANLIHVAWALTLSHYTRTMDVLFGYVASGRNIDMPDLDGLVGPLIDFLVYRITLDKDSVLREVLLMAQSDFLQSISHQHGALTALQRNTKNDNINTFFNTLVNVRNYAAVGSSEAQTSIELKGRGSNDPMDFDILVAVTENGAQFEIALSCGTGRLSEVGLSDVADVFGSILAHIIYNPEQRVSQLIFQS